MAKKKFTTSIDEEILKQMKLKAVTDEITVSSLIEKAFLLYVNKDKDKK